ncbi:MAG: class A beta-lactamase [Gemmatimonadaceae bacterium]
MIHRGSTDRRARSRLALTSTRVGAALCLAASPWAATLSAQATPPNRRDVTMSRLESEIARLARIAGGTVGVAGVHVESGREVYLAKGELFPMASTFKVPVAVQLLTRVDRGEIRLDSMVTLRPGDLHPGSGMLSELLDDPGVTLSLRNLLELMLLISDNSATDLVVRMAGGSSAVTARMREIGVSGVRVDRPTIRLIGDFIGVSLPSDTTPLKLFTELSDAVSDSAKKVAAAAFEADPRDTATPEGMARLLEKIWRKQVLSPSSSELLLDIMRRSTTGVDRLKGMLPPGTEVSHKTGTIGGTTNDAGIITLPDGAGHVIAVVFVKASAKTIPERERAIAQIARALYDAFYYGASAPPARR